MKSSLAWTLLLFGCAAGGAETAVEQGAADHRRLQSVRTEHTQLLERLGHTPAPQLESCRLTSGDCLIQVAETRARLVSQLRLDGCEQAPTIESSSRCVTAQLEHGKHTRELTAYFAAESWCFKQLTACTAQKAEEARLAALDQRFAARKQALEQTSQAIAAQTELGLQRARIEYVRATLPPDAKICQRDPSFERCLQKVEDDRGALDERLRQDVYDEASASESYAAITRAEASCSGSELDCLSGALASYGVYPESRKWVDRNLAALAEREKLFMQVSEETRQRCVADSQREHQSNIVSAYVAYVREPVLYFRMQLDKAFLVLHQGEVSCLTASRRAPRAAGPVASTTK